MTRRTQLKALVLFVAAYIIANLTLGPVFARVSDAVTPKAQAAVVTEPISTVKTTNQAGEEELANLLKNLDTVWLLVTAFLVFFMQAGFALVEAGFVRAKNVVNILMKNFFDMSVGAIGFWAIGFGIMFGAGNQFFGTEWFFLNGVPDIYPGLTVPSYAFFFFQFAFCATAATIASGAMAERTEFKSYLLYSLVVSALVYPVIGHWIWGGGWLSKLDTPFLDFAGSTVVHSTGGWIGLMGTLLLGARRGRFGANGKAIPGHNMTAAALGVFILWLGWFGFNPGSQLNADAGAISLVTVTTNLAAASGAIVAMLIGWLGQGKAQLGWALNGALAGLVAITAPCAFVTPTEAVIIGAIGGLVMYVGVTLLERMRVDDPVGAVSVHGFAGVWGTLAVGLFHGQTGLLHGAGANQLVTQLIGIVAVAVFALVAAAILFSILKTTVGLRVKAEGEDMGLDAHEHGMAGYPEFVPGMALGTAGMVEEPSRSRLGTAPAAGD